MLPAASPVPAALVYAGGGTRSAHGANPKDSKSTEDAKLRKAAGEFEAILLNSLWKSMKDTSSDQDDKDFDPTLESFDDWGMQAMSSAVGKAGGLGIKNLILKHLEPTIPNDAPAMNPAS